MSVIGTSTEWADLIDPMVAMILDLAVATWEGMPSPNSDDGEDKITTALCRALQQNRTARGLMFQIRTQVVELEPAAGADAGRMDIVFIPLVPREDIYFCLEAKRLNVVKNDGSRAYASEYVTFGMLRFVAGQYSRSVRHGGMVAYVLDGNLSRAISNIEFEYSMALWRALHGAACSVVAVNGDARCAGARRLITAGSTTRICSTSIICLCHAQIKGEVELGQLAVFPSASLTCQFASSCRCIRFGL